MRKPRIPKGVSFVMCPKVLLEDKEVPDTAKLLYIHLLCYAGDNNEIRPAVRTLAKRMGRSKETIQKGLVELETTGWLWRDFRKRRTTIYHPLVDPSRRDDVAFRNMKKIAARRNEQRRFRPNHHELRRGVKPFSGGMCRGDHPTGVYPSSPNQEQHQELPNKKARKGPRAPVPDQGRAAKGMSHSSGPMCPDPVTSWGQLSQAARRLRPELEEVELQEWLIDLMDSVAEKIPFLENRAEYQQGLLCLALNTIADSAGAKPADKEWSAPEIEVRVITWIEAYGVGEDNG